MFIVISMVGVGMVHSNDLPENFFNPSPASQLHQSGKAHQRAVAKVLQGTEVDVQALEKVVGTVVPSQDNVLGESRVESNRGLITEVWRNLMSNEEVVARLTQYEIDTYVGDAGLDIYVIEALENLGILLDDIKSEQQLYDAFMQHKGDEEDIGTYVGKIESQGGDLQVIAKVLGYLHDTYGVSMDPSGLQGGVVSASSSETDTVSDIVETNDGNNGSFTGLKPINVLPNNNAEYELEGIQTLSVEELKSSPTGLLWAKAMSNQVVNEYNHLFPLLELPQFYNSLIEISTRNNEFVQGSDEFTGSNLYPAVQGEIREQGLEIAVQEADIVAMIQLGKDVWHQSQQAHEVLVKYLGEEYVEMDEQTLQRTVQELVDNNLIVDEDKLYINILTGYEYIVSNGHTSSGQIGNIDRVDEGNYINQLLQDLNVDRDELVSAVENVVSGLNRAGTSETYIGIDGISRGGNGIVPYGSIQHFRYGEESQEGNETLLSVFPNGGLHKVGGSGIDVSVQIPHGLKTLYMTLNGKDSGRLLAMPLDNGRLTSNIASTYIIKRDSLGKSYGNFLRDGQIIESPNELPIVGLNTIIIPINSLIN